MTRTPVSSSSIKSLGHDPATNTLEIEFNSGRVYQHAGVTAQQHAALLAAPSIGKHYNATVRGKFDHTEVTERS